MGPSTGLARLTRVSLLCLLSSTATVFATPTSLFAREDAVCGGMSELAQCGADFPSEFCCPKNTQCQRLNSGSSSVTSVVCCPTGQDCKFIQPSTCDIALFDAKLHPDNQIHLSNTTEVSLPKCGDKCCPVGYSCNGESVCQANPEGPSTPSPTASATSSSPPYLISTPSPTAGAPSASQTSASPVQQTQQQGSSFSGTSFVAGFIPGIVIGIICTLAVVYFLKRRRSAIQSTRTDKSRFSGDFGRVNRNISDPIYDPEYARTDFIRRQSPPQMTTTIHASNSPPFTTQRNENIDRHMSTESGMVMQSSIRAAQGVSTGPGSGLTPRLKSLWERTPKLGFGGNGFVGLPSHPAPTHSQMSQVHNAGPAPPLVRAGSQNNRDPYKTPSMRTPGSAMSYAPSHRTSRSLTAVPLKTHLTPQRQQQTPQSQRPAMQRQEEQIRPVAPERSGSQETIDILMRPPSFLAPPKAPGMREHKRDTGDTTFTKLMERAGYEGEDMHEVRGWKVNAVSPPRR